MPEKYLKSADAEDASKGTSTGKYLIEAEPESNPMDTARQYFYGFNNMLYNVSGWGLVDASLSDLGISEPGVVGEWVRKNVFRGGDVAPKNKAERIARSAGEGTGFGALSAMGMGVVAQLSAKAPLAAKTSERVMSSIVEAFRSNPASFSVYESLTAGTSELARKTAEEAGAGTKGQLAAAMAGGIAPVAVVAAIRKAPIFSLYRALLGEDATNRRAVKQVSEAMRTGVGDEADLRASYEVYDRLGVEKPSIAEASGSPQLLAKQAEIEATAQGADLDHLVGRKVRIGQSIRDAGVESGPPARINDEAAVVSAVDSRMASARRTFEDHIDDLEQFEVAVAQTVPASDRVAIGSTLRDRMDTIRSQVGQEFSERAEQIGLNSQDGALDATSFIDDVTKRFFNKNNRFANREVPEILKIVKSLGGETAPSMDGMTDDVIDGVAFTFDDVKALRARLNDDISSTINDNKAAARQLIEAKKMLDDWFSNVKPPPGVDPEEWAKFRTDYREQFITRFEHGVPHKIARKTARGDYRTRDEAVADAFLQNEGTIGDYFRLYAGKDGTLDPEAAIAMESAIFDRVNSYAVKDGVVNEAALGRWMNNNRKILDLFPSIKTRLNNTRSAVEHLSRRSSVIRKRQRVVESSSLRGLLAKRGNPDEMIDAAIGDPLAMRALIRASESAGLGRQPVQSLVWQRAMSEVSSSGVPDAAAIGRFLEKNNKTLRLLYSDAPQHLNKLQDIYDALQIINRTKVPQGSPQPSGIVGQAEKFIGTGVAQASSRMFAVQSGRTGKLYPFIDGAVRFIDRMTKRKADALMKQAIFDPKVAADVHLAMSQQVISKPVERRLNAYLFQAGFGPVDDSILQGED